VSLLARPLLADENVDARVVDALRERGHDIVSVRERQLHGITDAEVLAMATAEGRVVLTHDSDFGTLAVHRNEPFIGIVYVRPGDLKPSIVLEVLAVIAGADVQVSSAFVVVAERRESITKVRVRDRR
jgi:predicted nuclease of predicted toxin-antitoxin system